MSRTLFITGTDTGVGKTLVSSALLAAASRRGLVVRAYKPVETGCPTENGMLYGPDCRRLAAAGGGVQSEEEIASYLFETPVAPMVAAEAEGTEIDPSQFSTDLERISDGADFVVVEGAGGILVPITARLSFLDLAGQLGLPVLVVVASRLGCINHILLTLSALESAGIDIIGYVMNETEAGEDGDVSAASNREVIARLTGVRELGCMPRLEGTTVQDPGRLAEAARCGLELEAILNS